MRCVTFSSQDYHESLLPPKSPRFSIIILNIIVRNLNIPYSMGLLKGCWFVDDDENIMKCVFLFRKLLQISFYFGIKKFFR